LGGSTAPSGWRILLDHVDAKSAGAAVITAMSEALAAWHAYRDDVAAACGLDRATVATS
jgi:hypothetical protein